MKLVINSCLAYVVARKYLFETLLKTKFDRFEDIILVLGKSPDEKEPYQASVKDVSGGDIDCDSLITCIDVTINNHDLNGYHALYKYHSHPRVVSDAYFYCHDTCAFRKAFPKFFSTFRIPTPKTICTPRFPGSNISVFGYDVVLAYKDNFDTLVSKDNGLLIEGGRPVPAHLSSTPGAKAVFPLTHFGDVVFTENRRYVGNSNPYKTNYSRQVYLYPEFGIYKFIFYAMTGDLLGDDSQVAHVVMPQTRRREGGGGGGGLAEAEFGSAK
jgi:hypothetical protein